MNFLYFHRICLRSIEVQGNGAGKRIAPAQCRIAPGLAEVVRSGSRTDIIEDQLPRR